MWDESMKSVNWAGGVGKVDFGLGLTLRNPLFFSVSHMSFAFLAASDPRPLVRSLL